MRTALLSDPLDFDGWRTAARAFRLAGVEPAMARFVVGGAQGALFEEGDGPPVIVPMARIHPQPEENR